ncbi:helix-turn-helix domain-containing protein [Sutcliffiella horikoshii]|uniref:helix-turn-helix domain-containing protein n=1 Tax=Sutcliffiella horikoshii TaxID=79883 RepID=UPI00165350CA|nr:helix-turn-helix domain-containing protein [Sutcliffiella horikoshii]
MTELGNRLKQAREEKGLSLEDLQTVTKIQKRYLIGIEEGNYSIMPGQFYARAFIRQYSEAVGLDPELIFEEYKNDIPANDKDEIPQLSRVKTRKQVPSSKNTKVFNFIPKVLMFLAFVAVVAIIYVLFQNWGVGSSSDTQENNKNVVIDNATSENEDVAENETENTDEGQSEPTEETEEEEPAEEKPTTGTLSEVSSNSPNAILELKDTDKFEVEISAEGRNTWVGVSNASGEYFLNKELKDGETETIDLSAQKEILFNVGWVPATKIKINGEPFDFPFPVNDVTTQRVTIKFVSNGQQ